MVVFDCQIKFEIIYGYGERKLLVSEQATV
jgi:hypothetical protein